MTKQELAKDMEAKIGSSFTSKPQVRKYLKKSDGYIRELLEPLQPAPFKRKNADIYFVPDVAQRILEM